MFYLRSGGEVILFKLGELKIFKALFVVSEESGNSRWPVGPAVSFGTGKW